MASVATDADAACVWVCEKALRKLYPDIIASINLSQKKLYLRYEKNSFRLSEIAQDIDKLGYADSRWLAWAAVSGEAV